ncbi:MAG: hypothetical protein Q7T81_15685 [Pseudolabrys sp.]|nr:hypothetical protein [Pseudolabrys sp.]
MWDKIKSSFMHSITILWARAVACAGLALVAVEALLQDPSVSAAVQSVLQPKYVPYYVIGIGLVTELARRRSLAKGE